MGNIINKLNLNKNPQAVEDNSIIFAKNIKLLKDGSLASDDGCLPINFDVNHLIHTASSIKNNSLNMYNQYKGYIDDINNQILAMPTYKSVLLNYISNNNTFINTSVVKRYIYYNITNTGTETDPFPYYGTYPDAASYLVHINQVTGKSFTSFPIPVFPKFLYDCIINRYVEPFINPAPIPSQFEGYTILQLFNLFNYEEYSIAVNKIKNENPDVYANNFFDIGNPVYFEEDLYKIESIILDYIETFLIVNGCIFQSLNDSNKKENNISISKLNTEKDSYAKYMNYYYKLYNDYSYYYDELTFNFVNSGRIIKVIPYNTSFYLLMINNDTGNSLVIKYDEIEQIPSICNCNWNYTDNTTINGYIVSNLNNDIILNIIEYSSVKDIPFKSINFTLSSHSDDESIYTQMPKVPLYNLNFVGFYDNVIPNGVYQFFIRYKIRDNFYTNWFPASKELYTGNSHKDITNIGGLKYVDVTLNSNKSFILSVDKPIDSKVKYESFQIGFIVSSDDTVVARSWKHFSMDTSTIYFDYTKTYITEINISDLTDIAFNIYNTKNITYFKNKLYISNYKETNFNPNFENFAKNININIKHADSYDTVNMYDDKPITIFESSGINYIRAIDGININDIVHSILSDNSSYFSTNHGTTIFNSKGIEIKISQSVIQNDMHIDLLSYNITHDLGPYGTTDLSSNDINVIINNIYNDFYYIRPIDGMFLNNSLSTNYDTSLFLIKHKLNDTDVLYNFVYVSIDISKIKISTNSYKTDYTTLIPHQWYRFYVHYVSEFGEITNGYKIYNDIEIFDDYSNKNDTPIIYPEFTDIVLPQGYVACFFTMQHITNNVAQLYNIHKLPNGICVGDCIELDSRLINLKDNITCKIGGFDYKGTYHASFDNSKLSYFGGNGKVEIPNLKLSENDFVKGFIVIDYNNSNDDDNLIKCTPFVKGTSYSDYQNMNLGGFICIVKKLNDSLDLYISGSDIYNKTITINPTTEAEVLNLETNNTLGTTGEYTNSNEYNIYSQYNLNYLSISLDVSNSIKTINSKIVLLKLFNSIQLSDIYELKSMYTIYTKKLFSKYKDTNNMIKFDNTIRSSILEGDEARINIFKFSPTDYYNIPSNKGIIINMAAIGTNILVHTEDSIFKFSGNNSLSSTGGEEIKVKQTEAFENGVSEVFGSEFGFAGLKHKSNATITEDGYIFYDASCKNIYMYSGEGQISKVSDSIKKILNCINIFDVKFANDYYNDKIYVQVTSSDANILTLSLNIRTKSFVSIHDFAFDNTFNTKTNCYVFNNNREYNDNIIYKIDSLAHDYSIFEKINKMYPSYNIDDVSSCIIDIITNVNFYNNKILNSLSWNCSKINSFYFNQNNNYTNDDILKSLLLAEENIDRTYAGDKLMIYSNECCTDIIDITKRGTTEPNSYSNISSPIFINGEWRLNYFRNVLNSNSNYNKYDDSENSLMRGKYFVTRFILNRHNNFKLENINFKMTGGE